jgi:hypothetical protein
MKIRMRQVFRLQARTPAGKERAQDDTAAGVASLRIERHHMTDTQILNAIKARIQGIFDDPDLVQLGPLFPGHEDDIIRLLAMRLPIFNAEPAR